MKDIIPLPADLFDQGKSARRDDVDTSHEAAESMVGTARKHHFLIMDVMMQTDGARRPGRWSAEEIADATSIDYVAVGKRMCELRRKQLIHRTDEKHQNRSGRKAYKYALGR